MNIRRRAILLFIGMLLCSMGCRPLFAIAPAPFTDGERVIFLGDSITRAGVWHSLISLFYETHFPERHIQWMNAGISGDTSAGAMQRLDWDVFSRKPDIAVVMFGMNDVARPDFPGVVGSKERIEAYRTHLEALLNKLKSAGIKVILCTPSPYDAGVELPNAPKPEINTALTKCAAICQELATKENLPLVDFNAPMNKITADFQKTNPSFTLIGKDRIHPGPLGGAVMAYLFLKAQGVAGTVSETTIDATNGKLLSSENATVSSLKASPDGVSFSLLEKALPLPFEGLAREALHLVPFEAELNRQILRITGLKAGEYELLIEDLPVGRWWQDDLASGINLSGLRRTPQYQQALQVQKAHATRHDLASSAPRAIAFIQLNTLHPSDMKENNAAAIAAQLEKLINDKEALKRSELGSGGFAQSMAKQYLQNKPKEAEIAAAITAADSQIYTLNLPVVHHYSVQPVVPPSFSGDRKTEWENRHDQKHVETLAKEFLGMLTLDSPGLARSNLRQRKSLQQVADLYHAGKWSEALDAYRNYLIEKVRNPAAYGLPESLLHSDTAPINLQNRDKTIARAEELLQGKLIPGYPPMPPGSVWLPRPKEETHGSIDPWSPSLFRPLVDAYLLTGDHRYLEQWIAYLDDWAMHEEATEAISPMDIADNDSHSAAQIVHFYQALSDIFHLQPTAKPDFPADSLARILRKSIRVYPPLSIVYHDSNPQNWTPGATATLMEAAMLTDEFRVSEYLFNRARQRHENYGTIQFLPDGAETEHALWYNCHYFDGGIEALQLAAAQRMLIPQQRPLWEQPISSFDWISVQRRKLADRARFFLQMLTPQSQYPIGNRGDQRTLPDWKSTGIVEDAILNSAPDIRVLINTLHGNTTSGLPNFTMSAFPYSGNWIMREGWSPQSGYAHFFCSPYPVGGHAFQGLKSNNGFWLSSSGQDLLVTGGFGSYSFDRSPLRVDGKEQFCHAGIGNKSITKNHKGFDISYINPTPPDWRSHSSPQFDFAEGVYSGPYGDFVDDHHDNKNYLVDFLAERAAAVISGVKHQRQVFFIKDPKVWIVVDRLSCKQSHNYTLDWRVPVASLAVSGPERHNHYNGKTFTPEMIKTDESQQTLTTSSKEMPNLDIHYFGPKLTFSGTREDGANLKDEYTMHYKMYDFWRISGDWKSPGNDLMISLIEAIPIGGVSSISYTEALGDGKTVRGFKAMATGGHQLSFLTTIDGAAKDLKLDGTKITGETLLLNGNSGIALDCNSMSYGGKTITPPGTDFEFSLPSNTKKEKITFLPIERPIQPVRITPERNIISGTEPITLSCATPRVELRYTLDGSEPTLQSPLYHAPFTVNNSVTVQARAFRPGLKQLPETLAGTQASVITTARYLQQEKLAPMSNIDEKNLKEGLNADYFEGNWKDLVFFPEQLKPLKRTTVKQLFATCLPNPQKVFGWTYSGMLNIPEDGVYTFHAPEEIITSTREAGYSLRLFVAQELSPLHRSTGNLNEWYPATERHAYGSWSIALQKGLHPFKLAYVDYRTDATERLNHPGMRINNIWDGAVPTLLISGPGLDKQPIPPKWFQHEAK